MIFNQFQSWARTAPASGRADGISALARAYLYSDLDAGQRADALRVMTAFLDDPSANVRRALAEALSSAADAPHHLVLALADDCASVSTVVLARSPVLSDDELIECAALAGSAAQIAIASRSDLKAPVAAALAEIAGVDALVTLVGNRDVALPDIALRRMLERHGSVPALRETLLRRSDLPAAVRLELVAATADALASFVTARNWLSGERVRRVTAEAGDRAAVTIAAASGTAQRDLVAHLRRSGKLTPTFAFRAILSGKIELFKSILAELSGMPVERVDGLTRSPAAAGFAALYNRCAMPPSLLPAFRLALDAARDADWTREQGSTLNLDAVTRVLTECAAINCGELDKLLVLLRRFESEAARTNVRRPIRCGERGDRSGVTPLVLTSIDTFDAARRPDATRRRNPFFAIDSADAEAELLVA